MSGFIADVFGDLGLTPSEPKIVRVRNTTTGERVAGNIMAFDLDGQAATDLHVGTEDSVLVGVRRFLSGVDNVSYAIACLLKETIPVDGYGDAYLWGYNVMARFPSGVDVTAGEPLSVDNDAAVSHSLVPPAEVTGPGLRKCYGIALADVTGGGSPIEAAIAFDGVYGFGLFRGTGV